MIFKNRNITRIEARKDVQIIFLQNGNLVLPWEH